MSEIHTYIETLKKIGINGIQIIQDGQEIGCFMKKEYKRQNQYSITKSFTSAAVGFAIEEGLFELNSKVCQLFDEAIKIEDPYWNMMEIRHLLTMTMGLETPILMGDSRKTLKESDWVSYVFRQKVTEKPGTVFQYNNAGPYLLGVLIQRKTEKNLIEYLTPRLFDKLEIKPLEAEFCPKGYVFGAGGLQMNVRELGKFGQFYLQRGKWKGEQILSEKWIEESTKKQVECGDYNNSQVDGYGYLFWHLKGDAYMANGKYGQYCIVLSDQNSVISVNSPETEQSDRVGRYIMKKLKEGRRNNGKE